MPQKKSQDAIKYSIRLRLLTITGGKWTHIAVWQRRHRLCNKGRAPAEKKMCDKNLKIESVSGNLPQKG
jgi:hypothetical protein